MTRLALILLILLSSLVSRPAAAAGETVETALNNQYRDKIMALRHPLEKWSQVYDANGNVLKGGHEGSWTIYGRILVKKVRVQKNSLEIEGRRVTYIQAGSGLAPTRSKEKVKLEINLSQPPSSASEANDFLSHVFAFTEEERIKSAPVFWRKYLIQQSRAQENATPRAEQFDEKRPAMIKEVEIDGNGDVTPKTELLKIRPGVTAPKPRYTPEPDYSEFARHERYRGVLQLEMIVDATGKIRQPEIVKPLGMGLDESAIATVLTWRFDPAQVDNKPVAVQLRIEVSFNLY